MSHDIMSAAKYTQTHLQALQTYSAAMFLHLFTREMFTGKTHEIYHCNVSATFATNVQRKFAISFLENIMKLQNNPREIEFGDFEVL